MCRQETTYDCGRVVDNDGVTGATRAVEDSRTARNDASSVSSLYLIRNMRPTGSAEDNTARRQRRPAALFLYHVFPVTHLYLTNIMNRTKSRGAN